MKITLTAWAERHFDPAPSAYTLRQWRQSGQIVPDPVKVGRRWMVDQDAQHIPLPAPSGNIPAMSNKAQAILYGT